MAEALGESYSLEELETICSCMSRLEPASFFDREGEIPVPAKVWVFFAQARATKRILIHV
jgi:hypothetical protein